MKTKDNSPENRASLQFEFNFRMEYDCEKRLKINQNQMLAKFRQHFG